MSRKMSQNPATKKYLETLGAECARDPKLLKYKAEYTERVQKRVVVIEKRLQARIEKEARLEFRRRLKLAGVPVMPQQTRRFGEAGVEADLNKVLTAEYAGGVN